MATKIRRNEKLASSRLQRLNFPKLTPPKRSAKKKNCMRISPCDQMMTKYWQNDYAETQSKERCHLNCVEVIGSHLEKPLSPVTSNPINKPSSEDTRCKKTSLSGRTAIGLVKRFRWIKTDTGFSMKCNFGPIDECQGIIASVVVNKTGVTEYWFYRRGFLSTIHYKDT